MNSDNLIQLLHNSFRITLGATASLIEVLQDPQQRTEKLEKLRQEWSELSEEWAAKGQNTEQEARNFVDNLWSQRTNSTNRASYSSESTTSTSTSAPPDVQVEIEALTQQIANIRSELEKLRNPNNPE